MTSSSRDPQPVAAHLWDYALNQEKYQAASNQLTTLLREMVDHESIQAHSIVSRVKSLASYSRKAEAVRVDGSPKYVDPEGEIQDCLAARVIVYTLSAREALCALVREWCKTAEDRNPGFEKRNGYDSHHFVVTGLQDPGVHLRTRPELRWYLEKRSGFEIQVRTVAGHAWAEYEHDVRYKSSGGYTDSPPDVKRLVDQLFMEAGGLRKFLDSTFEEIQSALRGPVDFPQGSTPSGAEQGIIPQGADHLEASALAAWLEERYPGASSVEVEDLSPGVVSLQRLGYESLGQVESALASIDSEHVEALMGYQLQPTVIRRLEDDLLAALGAQAIEALCDQDDNRRRRASLESRLARLRGKVLIYQIRGAEGDGIPEHVLLSAARTFRELVKLVRRRGGINASLMQGVVSKDNDLDSSARALQLHFEDEESLWVHNNMNRGFAERNIAELLHRLPGSDVEVLRAGELIASAPPAAAVNEL